MGSRRRWVTVVALLALAACRCASGVPRSGVGGPVELPPPLPAEPQVGANRGVPLVLYTDIVSAPPGAFVTLFGRGFGPTRGSSGVTLGGAPTTIVSWSERMIEIRLPATAVSGSLRVRTEAGESPPVKLAIHQGNIYFVALGGDDGWSGRRDSPGDGDGPFRTLARAGQAIGPGDVVYVRGGSYTGLHEYDAVWSFHDVREGTAERPIGVVAYPGEDPTIGDNTTKYAINFYHANDWPMSHVTVAKLRLRGACVGIYLVNMDDGRLVANEITGSRGSECSDGAISLANASRWKILGNWIHDNGSSKLDHALYLEGFGANLDVEIGWNRITDQHAGRGIQMYGHMRGDRVGHVLIHDNLFSEIDRDGILLGRSDEEALLLADVRVYNNVLVRAGRCEGWAVRVDNPTASDVSILHNTFVDNGGGTEECSESPGRTQGQIGIEDAHDVLIQNNVFLAVPREHFLDAMVDRDAVQMSHNLYFGARPAPWDTHPIRGNPGFLNRAVGDYHILPGSPALDAGAEVDVRTDQDGVPRPQGSASDLGAFEHEYEETPATSAGNP